MISDHNFLYFEEEKDWRSWLDENGQIENEAWVVIYKKIQKIKGLSFSQALDHAICYGWIDNMKRGIDNQKYALRFAPRKNRNLWSATNMKRIKKLIDSGLMTALGLAKIESQILSSIKNE